MWSKAFARLRRRLTFIYTAVFGVIILAIVGAAYTFIWSEIIEHERQDLLAQAYHEAEEWVKSGEKPCSETSLLDGSMLAYFETADGKRLILNQLGTRAPGRALWNHRSEWPQAFDDTRLLRMRGDAKERYRYLAAVVPVVQGNEPVGRLYMFKNMEFYYAAAYKTLFMLACVALLLFFCACAFAYFLAGISIRPISMMYERQKQFTADASHEMRTPLAVMHLAASGLAEDKDSSYSDFAKESLSILQNETEHLRKLTEALMELTHSEAADIFSVKKTVNFTDLCQKESEKMALLAQEKGIVIKGEFADGLTLQGEESSLARLLVILLDNAIKYSAVGSEISLRAVRIRQHILLEVADNGCGIAAEDKNKIFDRFYRVDKARSRSQGGLGLGLSLAGAIAAAHGGTIKVLDNKPCGTIFRVRLPIS